ncbi:hypothetical protein BDV96DRAFT_691572 [Lophiotrema nucula]|uniref:DUF7730 domain-containing protein n=1 Tax=Lophiotrema nucula TaxID=690887 RepID=A0A6A5YV27_9PLEO|nr:hypothetical protein BDV96DRAFT_691572 [Lophiotrema nucula]
MARTRKTLAKKATKTHIPSTNKTSGPPIDIAKKTSANVRHRFIENATSSPLLRLPAELREKIYRNVFGKKNTIEIIENLSAKKDETRFGCRVYFPGTGLKSHYGFLSFDVLPSTAYTLLSSVCRQLYKETSILPYKNNVFLQRTFMRKALYNLVMKERRLPTPQLQAIST